MTDTFDRLKTALSDRYTIESELGRGGMAIVYLAHDLKHDRKVAIKVLRPELAASLGADRFLREIKIGANLTHPHILTVLDSGEANGSLYCVMPYVDGESLRDRLNREGKLPINDALSIAREVADALGYAHEQGVVHRDVKPENILFEAGHAVVADFGIARAIEQAGGTQLTETGMAVGTPAYMSPEQATGEAKIDGRSDIYSLGCVLFEMLGGDPPYMGTTPRAILAKKLAEPVPDVSVLRDAVPEGLASVVKQAMAKDPVDRFATAEELGQTLQVAQVTPEALKVTRRRKPRVITATVAVAAVAAAVALGVWLQSSRGDTTGSTDERPSLAVLPFQNLGLSQDQYFADGITDEINARLAGISGLAVKSSQTTLQYAGSDKPASQIGLELNVQYILAGKIRWSRNADGTSLVRVTPQLIVVSDDTPLWADVLEEPYTEIFTVQTAIADSVVQALDITLLEGERLRLEARPTEDIEAYNEYLLGRFHWNRRSNEGSNQAIVHFSNAIELDSNYARAYAGLADSYSLLGLYGGMARPEAYAMARAAATRALELDETVAEAHIALAWVKFNFDWEWETAEQHFRRGIELNPSYATGHHWFAFYWRAMGEFDSVAAAMERAHELDPTSAIITTQLAMKYGMSGEHDSAIGQVRRALELNPDFAPAYFDLGAYYLAKGMPDSAVAIFQRAVALDSQPGNLGVLGQALAIAGDTIDALAVLNRLRDRSASSYVSPIAFVSVFVALGERDSTFHWLERAYEERSHWLTFIRSNPDFDAIRYDPRYIDLVARMNFPN
jgi:serine/threonine-protein kinase